MRILSEQQLNDAVCSWEHCYWGVIRLPKKQWDNPKKFTVELDGEYDDYLTPKRKSLKDQGLPYLTVTRAQLHKAAIVMIKEYPNKADELLNNPDSVITELLFQIALFGKPVFA